jgi:hypothetical protein
MSKKQLAERKKLYHQGVTHRRFHLTPYYSNHKYYEDYMDGFHARPFRQRVLNPPPIARFFLWVAALFGA